MEVIEAIEELREAKIQSTDARHTDGKDTGQMQLQIYIDMAKFDRFCQ